jgi:endonuclease/exonuclease/phosphatase family metal-dependent hydrolase
MRLAAYNVENLFDRAKILNSTDEALIPPVLEDFAALNSLLGKLTYSAADKAEILRLMKKLGLEKSDTGPYVILRKNRGKLVIRSRDGGLEIVADGRADWAGSLELRDEPVNDVAMLNTARVLSDLKADVLGVVEVESRPVLADFNSKILPAVEGKPFTHVMVIDGNDARGIDVGLMTRDGYHITSMISHVDDPDSTPGEKVFSRDCPAYFIKTRSGQTLVVMVNHFKSKGSGGRAADAKRKRQATRVRAIYQDLLDQGVKHIAIIGDLNDTPASDPISPLVENGGPQDAFTHPQFKDGGYPGTYGACGEGNKIDYLLLSPALFDKVQAGGVWRKGMWPGVRAKRWESYPTIKKEAEAASDHAAVWVDLDL